jgi:hypothetical protein
MIDGEAFRPTSAVLTAIVIAAQNLPLAEADTRVGAMNHVDKANDRWALISPGDRTDYAPAVL